MEEVISSLQALALVAAWIASSAASITSICESEMAFLSFLTTIGIFSSSILSLAHKKNTEAHNLSECGLKLTKPRTHA